MTVLPVVVTEAMKLPHQPTPKDVVAFLRALIVLLPVIATVLILAGIAIRGLLAGAIGTAYNAVAAQPAEAAAPAEGATSA
jgi:hypothetical protein